MPPCVSTTPVPANAVSDDLRLPADLLTAALALTLWVAAGSFVLTIVEGLGDDPARRLAVGIVLVSAAAIALWRRADVTAALQQRPSLVLGIAAAQIACAAIDGVVGGAFVALSLTSIGIASVVARDATVWSCVLVLETGYVIGLLADGHTLAQLSDDGQLGGVVGAMAGYPVAAGLFLLLRRRFTHFLVGVDGTLAAIRHDGDAFTPSLAQLLHGEPLALPPAPPPGADLTPTERRVVELLSSGLVAKQIARDWDVQLSTIRTHIKHAKKKTGARTLRELATFPTRPDWEPADVDR